MIVLQRCITEKHWRFPAALHSFKWYHYNLLNSTYLLNLLETLSFHSLSCTACWASCSHSRHVVKSLNLPKTLQRAMHKNSHFYQRHSHSALSYACVSYLISSGDNVYIKRNVTLKKYIGTVAVDEVIP